MLCKHKTAYSQSLFDFLSALKSTDGEPRPLASFFTLGWTRYGPVNQHYLGITIWISFSRVMGWRYMNTFFFSRQPQIAARHDHQPLQDRRVHASLKTRIKDDIDVLSSTSVLYERERRLVGDRVGLLWLRLKFSPSEHIEMFKCCYSNYGENSHSLAFTKASVFCCESMALKQRVYFE